VKVEHLFDLFLFHGNRGIKVTSTFVCGFHISLRKHNCETNI